MGLLAPGRSATPASRVLECVRSGGTVAREEIVRRTGLSAATVARAVSTLVAAGMLRYRPDHSGVRTPGRPSTPVEIDDRRFGVIGLHLGWRATTVSFADLTGKVIASWVHEVPAADLDLARVGEWVVELLSTQPGRQPLAVGVVAPWRDAPWTETAVSDALRELLGLDLASADHVAAMAAAEFLDHRQGSTPGVTAYLYARDTAGVVLVEETDDRVELSRLTSLVHYPTGESAPCACGRTGCLIATVGDHAVAARAVADGIVPEPRIEQVLSAAEAGDPAARRLLGERARILGRIAADVRDMVDPDRLVLVGQAFTGYPTALSDTVAELRSRTLLGDIDISVTRFGSAIQAIASCTVALGPVYRSPLELVPKRPAVASA
ncbi:ROK family transcriptional regulator [Granulicoccus phenolivorans]|uniref:ROK family transcriptional regulator n=1 Tax=Granulicoccus phenolivorans TaxID=266854 RepID=UPI0004038894|nr:ROK family transcriptional regulator [Granulicoccus phenolivorans]